MEFACARRFNNYVSIVVVETAAEIPSVESLSFLFIFFFYIFVGEPGASSFGRCRDASLPCVDRRGFGGHGHERN